MNREIMDLERRLQQYLDGELDAEAAQQFEEEVLASPELAEDVMDELSLRELVELRRARRRRPRTPGPRPWAIPMVSAVAVVLALLLWPRGQRVETPVFRGDPQAVVALEPVGDVLSRPTRFRWRTVPGSATYRIEIYDAGSRRILSETVRDTVYVVPPGVTVPAAGFWRLVPMDALGIPGPASESFRFTLSP